MNNEQLDPCDAETWESLLKEVNQLRELEAMHLNRIGRLGRRLAEVDKELVKVREDNTELQSRITELKAQRDNYNELARIASEMVKEHGEKLKLAEKVVEASRAMQCPEWATGFPEYIDALTAYDAATEGREG